MTDNAIHPKLEADIATREQKQWAVEHWNKLADDVERRAALGLLHTNVAKAKADCYRRTARAIQHEIDTGVAVCSCCFKPFGRGALAREASND